MSMLNSNNTHDSTQTPMIGEIKNKQRVWVLPRKLAIGLIFAVIIIVLVLIYFIIFFASKSSCK